MVFRIIAVIGLVILLGIAALPALINAGKAIVTYLRKETKDI